MYNSNLSLSIFPFKVATFQSLHVANFVKAEGSLCSYTHTHTVTLSKWRLQQLR